MLMSVRLLSHLRQSARLRWSSIVKKRMMYAFSRWRPTHTSRPTARSDPMLQHMPCARLYHTGQPEYARPIGYISVYPDLSNGRWPRCNLNRKDRERHDNPTSYDPFGPREDRRG